MKSIAVIYDMDGLIVDSEPFWRQAEIDVFSKVGLSLSNEDCMKTKGMRIDEVVNYWFKKSPLSKSKANKEEIVEAIMQQMQNLMAKHATPLPGIIDSLNLLKSTGVKIALASSSQLRLINTVVDTLKIRDYFDVILSAENEEYGKPHPAVFLSAANKMKVAPLNCLVFEDSLHGVIAARAANMKVIAIPDESEYSLPAFKVAHKVIRSMETFSLSCLTELIDHK